MEAPAQSGAAVGGWRARPWKRPHRAVPQLGSRDRGHRVTRTEQQPRFGAQGPATKFGGGVRRQGSAMGLNDEVGRQGWCRWSGI